MAFIDILKGSVFILTGELEVIHCLSNSFSRIIMFISNKGKFELCILLNVL